MVYLPDEVLDMICTQLWHQGDFQTLSRCACSGKRLAPVAITYLYRMQAVSPITNYIDTEYFYDTDSESDPDPDPITFYSESDEGDSDEEYRLRRRLRKIPAQVQLNSSKCRSLWQTIFLSSRGKTLYPYSHYIWTLNLRDFQELILQSYDRADRQRQIDSEADANKKGEAISKRTPLLEELSGNIYSEKLSRWIPRLPRLTHLEVCLGAATKDNGTLVRLHCPSFKRLHIRDPFGDSRESSDDLVAFLKELRPQSLESFKTSIHQRPGPELFHALNCHGESLVELKLNLFPGFQWEPIPQVSLLKGCTNLVSLSLVGSKEDFGLPESHIAAFPEIVAWLKECKKLRNLDFNRFFTSPVIASIFLDETIHLTSLEYEVNGSRDITEIHQALANQTSLQRLWLTIDGSYQICVVDGVVESLSKLANLTDLRLTSTYINLVDQHIVQLARSLTKLEVWSTCGGSLTDAIWGEVATLRSLRELDLYTSSSFTTNGIVGFIEKLGPGNKGLVLSVVQAKRHSDLSWTEQELIQATIAKQLQGRFECCSTSDYRRDYPIVYGG